MTGRWTLGGRRPVGLSPGAGSLVAAWLMTLAIAHLTGAAAVLLLLVAGGVALAAAFVSGWWRLRSIDEVDVTLPRLVTVGREIDITLRHAYPDARHGPVTVLLRTEGIERMVAASFDLTSGADRTSIVFDTPGTVTVLSGSVETAGVAGLFSWRRRFELPIHPVLVAPLPAGPLLDAVDASSGADDAVRLAGSFGLRHPDADVDGIRPWRQGESGQAIHWPTTARSREFIAHDRDATTPTTWMLPLDSDPARLRRTLETGLDRGHVVGVVEAPDRYTVVESVEDAAKWSAITATRRAAPPSSEPSFWTRPLQLTGRVVEPVEVRPLSRWAAAMAALVAVNMLLGGLGGTSTTHVVATVGIILGAALSVRFQNGRAPRWVRIGVAVATIAALLRLALNAADTGGLVEALRGPLPDLLMILLVLHGAESADRRTARVHLAISAAIVAYAAGFRIDDQLGWMMAAWGCATVVSLTSMTIPPRVRQPVDAVASKSWAGPARVARAIAWTTVFAAISVGIASLISVPDQAASFGLPAVSNDRGIIDTSGAIVGPNGNPTSGDGTRGVLGQSGGYPGFSATMDTSIRGDLGDDIVMRVRSPEAAFWRGQTFTEFDGRIWTIADDPGFTADGPQINVPATLGDLPARSVPVEELVQTFHVETGLPNLVFGAARPATIVFDGTLTLRPDGAIRTDRALTSGTIYTVVSQRAQVTAALLRAQGDAGTVFGALAADSESARTLLAPYLAIPESTSERTIALAAELRVEGSTYDTIRAYEAWFSDNTTYDLDAPVPGSGVDAVDDYLFESQRGFCEQIASALAIMLRSQGVPTRIATGYVSGERDRISGLWEVRASDAHSWVEVWFPDTGWQPFDPTAAVPLAGEAERSTVGRDVAGAIIDAISSNRIAIATIVLLLLLGMGASRAIREVLRRRRRGRWGLLHDRMRGQVPVEHPDRAQIEAMFDRVAFDPAFEPSEVDYEATRALVARAAADELTSTSS